MGDTVKGWKIAPTSGLESDIMLGPIQNEMQYNIVKRFFEDSRMNGHNFACGEELTEARDDYVILPAIVRDPPDNSLVVTGEAFGTHTYSSLASLIL